MKIVIDIPEDLYDMIRTNYYDKQIMRMAGFICAATAGGTPLPKGHGDLIDRKELTKYPPIWMEDKRRTGEDDAVILISDILKAEAIIEADITRDCKTCGHSNSGKCAGTEECHDCMWESKYIEADKGE